MNSKPSTRNNNLTNTQHTQQPNMVFFDPSLIKAAKNIYRSYCNLNIPAESRAVGVVIDRDSHRGQLAFNPKPILLPRECFIPLKQIEAESY